nr:VOC family protein [Streptomyces lydicus]
MDITIHTTSLPHDDRMRRSPSTATSSASRSAATSGRAGCAGSRSARPAGRHVDPSGAAGCRPGVTDDERRTITEMMAKGTYGWILLATPDLDATFEKVQAGDTEVVQEPTEQPYGIRDCAFRDPAGNLVRIQELR